MRLYTLMFVDSGKTMLMLFISPTRVPPSKRAAACERFSTLCHFGLGLGHRVSDDEVPHNLEAGPDVADVRIVPHVPKFVRGACNGN